MSSRSVAPALARVMGVPGVLFLALSAATPASSVFVIVPEVLSQAGSGALIAMAAAAVLALCVAEIYAELGSAFPFSGGEYVMVARTLGPGPGFMVLGLNLLNSLLVAAVFARGVAEYVDPGAIGLTPTVMALLVVATATLLAILNIRTGALITGLFVAVELIALGVIAWLGFGHAARPLESVVLHPLVLAHGGLAPAPLISIALAVAVSAFAYDGYGSAVYFGEEMREEPRQMARAIGLAVILVAVAEIAPLIAILTGAPDLRALLGSPAPLPDFVERLGGVRLRQALMIGVALAIFNAVIATMMLSGRQLFSTGRDETWTPRIDRLLRDVHPRLGSPWAATLVAGALAMGLCVLPLKLLTIATGAGVALIYAILCLAVIAGRRGGATALAHHRVRFHPVLTLLTLAALIAVLFADWMDADEGRPGLLISVAVIAVFGLWWRQVLRPRGWSARLAEQ